MVDEGWNPRAMEQDPGAETLRVMMQRLKKSISGEMVTDTLIYDWMSNEGPWASHHVTGWQGTNYPEPQALGCLVAEEWWFPKMQLERSLGHDRLKKMGWNNLKRKGRTKGTPELLETCSSEVNGPNEEIVHLEVRWCPTHSERVPQS